MRDEKQQAASVEISLKDVVGFFIRNQRLIVFFGVAGLLFSTAYILLAPKKYEARWQMEMSQFTNTNANTSTSNIEDPAALIQRLRFSSSYPAAVQQSCGISKDGELGEYLGGALEVQIISSLDKAVGMKLRARSDTLARQCAEAIVAMIVVQQQGLIDERLAGRKELLLQYQQALLEEKQQLDEIKNTEFANFAYLAKLDKLSWLRTRIDALNEEAYLSKKHPAKLTFPMIVSSKPVSPRVGLALLFGVSLGLILGVLSALVRDKWRRES